MSKARALLARARHSPLVSNTISYTLNFGLQLILQLGFFMLVSRTLGAEGYGVFVSITSVSIITALIIGLGSDYLLVQRVAVDPKAFPAYFGHALVMMAVSLPVVAVPTLLLLRYLVGDKLDLPALVVISLTDLVFTRLTVLAGQAYMAFDRANKQLFINLFMAGSKLVALAVAVWIVPGLTLSDWAWWFCAAGALSAAVSVAMVLRDLGRPIFTVVWRDLRLSSLYCLEFLSMGSMKDIDKPIVVHVLGPEIGGQYAAGFRIIDAASAPVRAFLYATYTRHFRHAAGGELSSFQFALKLLPVMIVLSVPVAIGLFFIADFLPLLLGADFAETPVVVKLLLLYPMLMGISGVGADLLRAVGRQKVRLTLLVLSSLALVPIIWTGSLVYGLAGAALFRFVVQIALTVLTWVPIFLSRRRGRSREA